MPSLSPTSDPGPLDFGHLARMTCGESALEREVLEMFLTQTDRILAALAAEPGETAILSHTLKGSARAIGAFRVADAAAGLEDAARNGADPVSALEALRKAIADARRAIMSRLGPA